MKLRVLDLFSGIGGFSLGLERTGGFETVAFCEYAEFPRKVLAKHWPDVPIYPDVRELTAERIHADGLGRIDLICGGYPCQPFSTAGKRGGAEDDRHLWPEMSRLVATLRPAWVIGENVAGHVTLGLDDVLSDLGTLGYAAQAFVIPACALGAHHRRDRIWIVAHAVEPGREAFWQCSIGAGSIDETSVCREVVADTIGKRSAIGAESESDCEAIYHQYRHGEGETFEWGQLKSRISGNGPNVADAECWIGEAIVQPEFGQILSEEIGRWPTRGLGAGDVSIGTEWEFEPGVGRVADGVPNRSHRLKALGNAVVPQIPEMIGHAILQSMKEAA